MKVLLVLHETSIYNGSFRSAKLMVESLSKMGVDFLIITPNHDGAYKIFKQSGYNVQCVTGYEHLYWGIDYKFKGIIDFTKRLQDKWWMIKMIPVVKKYNPDIIYSNTSAIECGHRLAKLMRKPHVFHIREFLDKDKLSTVYFDKVLKDNKSYYIAVSDVIADAKGLKDSEKCQVIYNCIHINDIKSVPVSQRHYFLFVGAISENKGTYDLLNSYKAFISESSKKIPLKFAGGNPESISFCKKVCEKLGIAEYVEFLGGRSDVDSLMQNALAVVVPSRYESFGRVVAEGMSNKALIIGRNTTGTKEHFNNGLKINKREIGLRFEDNEEMTKCLHKAATMDSNEYEAYIEGAYKVASELYTKEKMAESTYQFLDKIINR